jgi:hypothetical protein
MNPRTTGLLLLVAAALGAFVYLYEVRGGEQRKDAEQAAKRLFPGVQSGDVAWVTLTTTDGKPARVERRQGAWQVVEPLAFPGDAVNLDGIAAGLADLASDKEIETPQAPEIYGIDATSRVVRFGSGGKEYTLRVGKKAPIGSSTYVATGTDEKRVFTIPTFKATNLERSLDDLRDRRVLNFDRASIAGIDVGWPGGQVRLQRGDGGWQLVEPMAGPADETTVDTLLSNLSYLRAESFEDAPRPDAQTGLDRPAFEVTLTGKAAAEDGAGPAFRAAFGNEENGKRLVRGGQPGLYRVTAQRLEDLPRSVAAYRFKELTRFVATDARSLELTLQDPGSAAVDEKIEHGAEGWRGSPEPVDPGKAARLVAELARLRGADILSENASEAELAQLGLSPPRVRIRVLAAGSDVLAAAELGAVDVGTDPDGKGPAARSPSSSTVFRLAPTTKEWLPTGLASFRALFVAKPAEVPPAGPEESSGEPSEPPTNPEPEALSGE